MELIMKTKSIHSFTEECEKHLSLIFNCQRVNMILVDRFKKTFFRYKRVGPSGESKLISYPIEQSIAGFVAISCQPIYTDKVVDE